jgi:hypothetical protein
MKRIMISVVTTLLVVSFVPASGYCGKPIMVVSSTADGDRVGENLVFTLKDKLRGSNTFDLIADQPDSAVAAISIVTIATSDYSTAYSVVYKLSGPYLDFLFSHSVGICGEQRIASQALSLVRSASQIFTE